MIYCYTVWFQCEAAAVKDEEKIDTEDAKTNDEPAETEHQDDTAGDE